uniref:Transcription initiation factor IIB n=1 Tax=Pithovirus LCPAC202 TaxID=2506592 RepID=A0A481Z5G8_9VIRU|nr:MAG: transcription initiation factor IIB [Pithovirus LCPAC202]
MATIIDNEDGSVEVVFDIPQNGKRRTSQSGTKSILPDMEVLSLDTEIKQEAERIYIEMNRPTRKDKTRLELVFACLHFAYAKRNQINSSKELAVIVGINPANISKIIGKFSLSKVGYHFDQRFYGIVEYIKFLSGKINLPFQTLSMSVGIGTSLVEKRPSLEELQPDLVASAIIIYNLSMITNSEETVKTNKNALLELVICNQKKLDQMIKTIAEYDNQN